MQIVSTEDHLHGMSNPIDNLYEMQKSVIREKWKKKKTSKCYLLKILHRVLNLKTFNCQKQVDYCMNILAFTKYNNAFENTKLCSIKMLSKVKKKKKKE